MHITVNESAKLFFRKGCGTSTVKLNKYVSCVCKINITLNRIQKHKRNFTLFSRVPEQK